MTEPTHVGEPVALWKAYFDGEWGYFEVDEFDALVAGLTEAAVLHAYAEDNSGRAHRKRRRLSAWLLRGKEHTADNESRVGMHKRRTSPPQVWALIGAEWVEADWTLIEPTVTVVVSARAQGSGGEG